MIVALLALVGVIPVDGLACDRCDLIEINHFYDERGKLLFRQVIFWDYHTDEPTRRVAAYRMADDPTLIATRLFRTNEWCYQWKDGKAQWRRVVAKHFRQTWTQHDPEMRNRTVWPTEQRRGLATPSKDSP